MSAAPQPDGQPINRAVELLRHASDNEALELDHPEDSCPAQLDPSPNIAHGSLRKRLQRLWRRHVSMTVPHVACRDHLGKQMIARADKAY